MQQNPMKDCAQDPGKVVLQVGWSLVRGSLTWKVNRIGVRGSLIWTSGQNCHERFICMEKLTELSQEINLHGQMNKTVVRGSFAWKKEVHLHGKNEQNCCEKFIYLEE